MDVFVIVFAIFGLAAAGLLVWLAFKKFYKYFIMGERCTARTHGVVVDYSRRYRGSFGVFPPITEYRAGGETHRVTGPEFKRYMVTSVRTPRSGNTMTYEVRDDVLYVKYRANSRYGIYENPMRAIFPLGQRVEVHYDPEQPSLAYAGPLRTRRKIFFWLLIAGAILVFLVGLLPLIVHHFVLPTLLETWLP